MQNFRASIVVFVVGVLIGIGGIAAILFLLPHDITTSPDEPIQTSHDGEKLPSSNTPKTTETQESGGDIVIPSRITDLVFPKSTFDRKASIVFWVNNLTEDQIVGWIEQSTDSSWHVASSTRTELQTILLQKLTVSDPEGAVEFVLGRDEQQQQYSWAAIVFQTWASVDIESAVARVKELDAQVSPYFVGTILSARDDLSLERMRKIAVELGDERSAFAHYFANLSHGTVQNPRETWYEILNIANRESVQETTSLALSKVAVAWVQSQGMNVLDEMLASISNNSEYSTVEPAIFRRLSVDQPETIFDYIMSNLGERAIDVIDRSGMTYSWARKDPKSVLEKSNSLPPSQMRKRMVQNAIWRWAEINPRELLTQLELVPSNERESATVSAIEALTKSSPTEATQFVLNVSDDALQTKLARSLVQTWGSDDFKAAKEWVLSLRASESMRTALIGPLAQSVVHTDPRGAFELTLQQPIVESEQGVPSSWTPEGGILSFIVFDDVDLAIELLPQVRDSGKSSAFRSVGSALIRQGNSQQALDLADQLPEKTQLQYLQEIAGSWSLIDPKGLLNGFDTIPDASKSKVALRIIAKNEVYSNYSDEEIARFGKYLSQDDKELLDKLKKIDMNDPSPEELDTINQLYSN